MFCVLMKYLPQHMKVLQTEKTTVMKLLITDLDV